MGEKMWPSNSSESDTKDDQVKKESLPNQVLRSIKEGLFPSPEINEPKYTIVPPSNPDLRLHPESPKKDANDFDSRFRDAISREKSISRTPPPPTVRPFKVNFADVPRPTIKPINEDHEPDKK